MVRKLRRKKVNKPRQSKPKPVMARRRRIVRRAGRTVTRTVRRAASGRGKFGGFLKRGLIGDTTQALGAGLVVGAVTDRVAPQATPFASLGAEFAAGGVGGMVLAEGIKSFIGMPSILTGLLGNIGLGGQQSNSVGAVV